MVEVLHAGSLTRLVREGLAPALAEASGLEVSSTPRGSITLANGIRDGSLTGDVFLSADVTANELLIGDDNHDRTRWSITFAGNEVVFAYSAGSSFAAALDELPWYEVATRPGFRLRRGDPDTDPLAYYLVMVCQLAEAYYGIPGLKTRLLGEDRNLEQVTDGVPSPSRDDVDGAFLYLNVALDSGIPFVRLPAEINLGDRAHGSRYAAASYMTSDTGRTFRGRPIAFSATVLRNAPDPTGAVEFVRFLCSPPGQRIVDAHHLRTGPILLGGASDQVPAVLQALAER